MKTQHSLKLARGCSRLILICLLSICPCNAGDLIDFRNDVVPVLTKLGCNSGACHGSAAGRGDFRLSLYGSRPENDHDSIVRQFQGRRVNLVNVDRSLLLRKPGGVLDHEGGYLFGENDQAAVILKSWLQQGALNRSSESPRIVGLETGPQPLIFETPEVEYPLNFRAEFDDGSTSDVTKWVVVTTPDESAVAVDFQTNLLQIKRPGRHVLIARFLDQVIPVELIIPFSGSASEIQWPQRRNLVDDHIYRRMNQLRIAAEPLTDDATFLRRTCLSLTGKLPTPSEVRLFLEDKSSMKREALIRQLLQSDELVDYWTFQLAQQLRLRTQPADRVGAQAYHFWLNDQLKQGIGWDQMVRKMLLASGDSHLIGEANFYRTVQGAREQAEFVSEALMGVTLRCANCHDHPFDRWTQDDYHGLAAIFAKTRQGRLIEANPLGMNTHPLTGQAAMGQLPGGSVLESNQDGRRAYSNWLLAEDNPFLAKAMVNRIWKALMGRGLVEPVDDLRLSNPATHPELLRELALDFAAHDYDIRHTISLICRSDAFQRGRAIHADGNQEEFYGCRFVKRLPAEVLADAICDVTGVPEAYANEPTGTRAIQLYDSKTPSIALDVLGRCSREESCESIGTVSEVGLSSQLHFMNGQLLNQKITANEGRLFSLIADGTSDSEIVRQFYLLSYNRPPAEAERAFWQNRLAADQPAGAVANRRQRLEDFVWSLLNSEEFYSNH